MENSSRNNTAVEELRPPLPPFDRLSAIEKVRLAEDAWNSRDPDKVSKAYTPDSRWRNRSRFVTGRQEIVEFLRSKWRREKEYRLIKELWSFSSHRIAVRFVYEWQDREGKWWRSHGNENWQFDNQGLMEERHASINDVPIAEHERLLTWKQGRRPDDFPGLSELKL